MKSVRFITKIAGKKTGKPKSGKQATEGIKNNPFLLKNRLTGEGGKLILE